MHPRTPTVVASCVYLSDSDPVVNKLFLLLSSDNLTDNALIYCAMKDFHWADKLWMFEK